MKKTLIMLCATTVVIAACQSQPTTLPPGQYSHTERSVNETGTERTQTTNTNVYVDPEGDKKATQTTTTTKDPEGWFNKSTSTTTQTYD